LGTSQEIVGFFYSNYLIKSILGVILLAFIRLILTGEVDPTESQALTDQNVIVDHDTAVVVGIDTVRGTENGTASEAV